MKKVQFFQIAFILAVFTLFHMPYAAETAHAESDPAGELIHTSTLDGHTFEYRLIDMTKMKMKDATHHLMVKVTMTSPGHSHTVTKAKVGFAVTGPAGNKKKVMGMSMGENFGANVDLRKKGKYTIHTKVFYETTKLKDKFSYKIK